MLRLKRSTIFLASLGLLFTVSISPVWAADVTPPATTLLSASGTMGLNGWYVSTLDVALRATDLESGPASTTYQVGSHPAVVNDVTGGGNPILNPSFENGSTLEITNWDAVSNGSALLYQTATPSMFGYGSAAYTPASAGGPYQYWTNVNYAADIAVSQTYSAGVWIKTVSLDGTGAWMEVWLRDSTGAHSDQLAGASAAITGTQDWQLRSLNFTVPAGYNRVYFKLGAQASDTNGFAYFDGANLTSNGGAITNFSITQNGTQSLSYYSTDVDGNIESANAAGPYKIDTAAPQDWSNFNYAQAGNNHTFVMKVNVRDTTSGVNVSTAQFRAYDASNCDCWTSWTNVASVLRVDNGTAAVNGYTGYVTLTTPAYDYGNSGSAVTPQVQFRINDMAGSVGYSPTYSLFGPWLQLVGMADIYSGGPISISGAPPSGQTVANGVVVSGSSTISNVVSTTNWLAKGYTPNYSTIDALATHIPAFSKLVASAVSLPSGRLPSANGIYQSSGSYTIDSGTLTTQFQNSVYSAVIIINGNLNINQNFSLNANTGVVFLVTGNVSYRVSPTTVTSSAGVIIAAGTINTGTTYANNSQLTHSGSLIGLGGLSLGRNLSKNGNPTNTTQPGERINFMPRYLANQTLANLLSSGNGSNSSSVIWLESQ